LKKDAPIILKEEDIVSSMAKRKGLGVSDRSKNNIKPFPL